MIIYVNIYLICVRLRLFSEHRVFPICCFHNKVRIDIVSHSAGVRLSPLISDANISNTIDLLNDTFYALYIM